jgi:SAM-dependent methyltransferase
MKLSELVDYLNQLDAVAGQPLHQRARTDLDGAMHTITNHDTVAWPKMYRPLQENLRQLDQLYHDIQHNINTLRSHARNLVAEQEISYYQESTRLWQHEMIHETVDYRLARELNITQADHEAVLGRVLRWSDWQYPGMIIAPARAEWITHLVGLDPLYLVDTDSALLAPAVQRFKPQYQQRLRTYVVPERQPRQILADLPDQQFSLVFAYNFFNYRPFETVCRWLSEIFTKLRPGGTLFFTFNDCDWAHAVGLTERHFMCYTPGHRVAQHLRDTGFDIQEHSHGEADMYWIEARRPGELSTMRAGQNLAKIVARSK